MNGKRNHTLGLSVSSAVSRGGVPGLRERRMLFKRVLVRVMKNKSKVENSILSYTCTLLQERVFLKWSAQKNEQVPDHQEMMTLTIFQRNLLCSLTLS